MPASVYKQTVEIALSTDEMLMAAEVGGRRNTEAKAAGLPDVHGYYGDGLGIHILGAQAELAVAQFLGVPWEATVNTFKAPDVLSCQVRCRSRYGYDLLIRPNDAEQSPYVLVVGDGPFYIVGWIYGCDAKKQEWLATYGGREPAYFVPKQALRRPSELLGMTWNDDQTRNAARKASSRLGRVRRGD